MNRYRQIPIIKEDVSRRASTIYPFIPLHEQDTYVITTSGDRFDLLASAYYQDSNMWWAIASSNPDINRDTLSLLPGVQIRIPYSKSRIFEIFNSANQTR